MLTPMSRNHRITNAAYEGSFIYVRQIQGEIYVIYLPEKFVAFKERSIFVICLDETLYVQDVTEIKLPYFTDVYISRIYTDRNNGGDFVITGTITSPEDSEQEDPPRKVRTDFKVKNYTNVELRPSTRASNGIVFDLEIDDIVIDSISRKGDDAHVVGYRVSTEEEVYLHYNSDTKTVIEEMTFFSQLGLIRLIEVHCNADNEVFVVGHVETETGSMAYFNKFLSTGVGQLPVG